MRFACKLMIVIGVADLLVACGAVYFHALAFASQYTGFAAWLLSLSPDVEPTSVEHENLLARVLTILGRTSGSFFVATGALAVSGLVLILAGVTGQNLQNRLDGASRT